jgi:hypothetical protein
VLVEDEENGKEEADELYEELDVLGVEEVGSSHQKIEPEDSL